MYKTDMKGVELCPDDSSFNCKLLHAKLNAGVLTTQICLFSFYELCACFTLIIKTVCVDVVRAMLQLRCECAVSGSIGLGIVAGLELQWQ